MKVFVTPYVWGISEKIGKICKELNIFSQRSTLRSFLSHVKDPADSDKQKGVVYRVPCECSAVYIGETGRQLKTQIAEHKRAVQKVNTMNAIACHV